jgi:hypothetical protein
LGILGNEDQVAARGKFASSSQAVPVHLRDHRLGEIPNTHPPVSDVPRPGTFTGRREIGQVEALIAISQVVSGTEALAIPSEDGHADIRVSIVILQRAKDVASQCVIEGVSLFRPVERNAANARLGLVDLNE